MKNHFTPKHLVCLLLAIVLTVSVVPAWACSWAAFVNGDAAIVARTMAWYCNDDVVVMGHGRNVKVRAAETPNALEYASRYAYASLQIHSFDRAGELGMVVEGMNEKGLQGSILFLKDSILPTPQAGRKDLDPIRFIDYALSNFATVRETLGSLERINFVSPGLTLPGADGERFEYRGRDWPLHFALTDATGDKTIIEFIKGEVVIYHDREYDAMTNEPPYDVHLAIEAMRYNPGGSILPEDRRARAKGYLRDMHERGVRTPQRALIAMRGLLASLWAGTEEIDRVENEVYPTIWGILADQRELKYYLRRYDSWCTEIYDFSMFDSEKPEVTLLGAADCPRERIEAEKSD